MYGNVEDWSDIAASRGTVVSGDAASLQALHRASDYIRIRYVLRFSDQYDGTSPEVIEATYIAAGYELTTPGFWSTVFTPSQVKVLTKVGDIQWTIVPGASGTDGQMPVSPMIENLLLPLTRWGMPAVFVV